MRIHVLGTRGSRPTPGPDTLRFGGNTSCIAIAHDGCAPSLVLDAGSGLVSLTALLPGAFDGTILLSHLHWDHLFGLPFFAGGDHPDARVDLYLPEQGETEQVLEGAMSPPFFPIRPAELQGSWRFRGLGPGTHPIEGFEVLALDIPHKGGRTFGYRIDDGATSIAYLPDHGPVALGPGPDGFGACHDAALRLAEDVDVLFHDAQHTATEFPRVADFGHSAIDYAVMLAAESRVKQLRLFHHDPGRSDEALDAIEHGLRGYGFGIAAAREGEVIDLADPSRDVDRSETAGTIPSGR